MSLIPFLYRDFLGDHIDRTSRLFDHNFGVGLRREDLFNSLDSFTPRSYLRPWRIARQSSNSSVQVDDRMFQVIIDVQQFSPDEITVKTAEGMLVVEGKHEEKADEHGYISRHFVRKYQLPADSAVDLVSSTLSSDGILTITAPTKVAIGVNERSVPITHTGPARPAATAAVPVVTSPPVISSAQPPAPTIQEINIPVTIN